VNDVTRLQALVDTKKVVVTKATIWEALRLDDKEGVDCLPNEEIFAELARMGYEKPSTKLTFYKAFFSSHLVDADKNVKEINAGDAAEGDVSAAHGEVPTVAEEPSIPSLTPPTPPPQPPQDIPSTSQVQQTPPQSAQVEHLEFDKVAQDLEITKLKRRVKKLERRNTVRKLKFKRLQRVGTSQRVETSDETVLDDVSNQERMIVEMDQDDAIVLEDDKEEDREVADVVKDIKEAKRMIVEMDQDDAIVLEDDKEEDREVADVVKDIKEAKVGESAQDQGRQVESQAKIYKIDMDHANKVLSMQEDESKPANVQEVVDVVTTAKLITEVVTAASETVTAASVIITTAEAQVPAATLTAAPAIVTVAPSRRRNFDREDLEALWSLVKERFSTTKPKNFSNDFLLVTLRAMFEKPDIHAQI
nr:hypothetical protein [Tanacetum cinerariifolium]